MRQRNGGRTDRDTAVSRRGVLAATGTVSVAVVAGCSGDGGTGTDEPSDDDPTPTDDGEMSTATATDGEMSTATDDSAETSSSVPGTASSTIEELAIVEHQPNIGYFGSTDQDYFPVDVTVENGGDEQTDVTEYNYDVVAYDADDNDVSGSQGGTSSGEGTEMSPGGRGSLTAYTTVEVDPSEVARYEVTIQCTGVFEAEGVYCQ